MDQPPSSPQPTAEGLFADFLDRLEAGEAADFTTFCALHPAQAEALRRVHTRWQAMTRAFTQLSQEDGAGGAAAASKTVDDLKARLGTPGGRLARYTLRQEIARGAMGRIVHAFDEELRRDVALKIHRGAVDDSRLQRRFLEEAQIGAQLDHPGIVPIHELGVDGEGRPFFAMQLVRGRDLGEILAAVQSQQDGWSRTRVLGVLLRVCEAMAFAHDKGVVHRDLKPANIMVGRFGETYVMDWGLAHVQRPGGDATGPASTPAALDTLRTGIAAEDSGSALLTKLGDVVGTPAYMAPEQAAGGEQASPAVDIYALGAILYHLLAGDMPYAAGTRSADDVLRALRAGPPPPLCFDVPPELRAICERAMAREPAGRYASMVELADDLRAFLEVRTVRAYATGRFAELRKWVARNRTLSFVIAGSLLALLAGAVAVTTLWVRAEEDRARADSSAARLQSELERSTFQRARQALQLDNSMQAADTLWHAHLLGNMPRATAWALKELAERDPYLVAVPERADRPIAFLPGGDLLLVGGADGRLQLREPRTLATVSVLGEAGPKLTAVAPLDRRRTVAGTSRGDLLCFDLETGSVVSQPAVHQGRITALAVATDGGFASAGSDGRVLWWARPGAPRKEVLVHKAGLNALSLRPDGAAVMAAGDDGTLVGAAFDDPWRFSRRRLGDSLAAVAFTESADRLWVSDSNHQVRLVDLRDASRQWVHWTRNGACQQLARTRDGSVLVGGSWRTDRWAADGSDHTPVALRPVDQFALSPDQRWLATASAVSGLGVIDLAPIARRRIPGVGALGLSGDGRFVATSAGNHATIHDVTTGAVAKAMPKGSNGWLALDRDGTHLSVSKMPQGTLAVYDVRQGTQLYTTTGPTEGSGFAARFSPDGAELAFAAGPGKLRRVRTADGAPLAEYSLTGVTVGALSWSGDGRSLAAVGSGLTAARTFDLATGTHRDEEFAGSWPANATPALTAVALSHDGHTIAVGNLAGQVRVRRRDGSTLAVAGHDGTVWSLQFAGDDPGLLFSSGGAQGLAAWDLDSGECCYQSLGEQLSQLQVSVDGATLACMTPDGALLVDLAYHDRHVAGNLPMHLPAVRSAGGITPAREASLQAWAAAVMARPWPRWQ